MPCRRPARPPRTRRALPRALLLLLTCVAPAAGCAHGPPTTVSHAATPQPPAVDDGSGPAYEPEFSWFVRSLPTPGVVRVLLYLDAGARDAAPPQVATLAAFALAARLSSAPESLPVRSQVTPDATAYELDCPAADVVACARHLARLLQPTALTPSELAAAHRKLRDDRAGALGDDTRAAQGAALRALFGDDANALFPLGAAERDGEADLSAAQGFIDAHYGSQRALLLAEGDVASGALDGLGETLRGLPRARTERAERHLTARAGVSVVVAHAGAASVALRARDADHARAVVHLLRDGAFLGDGLAGGVDLAAFTLRGGAVVLLTVPTARLTVAPQAAAGALARLALRASDAADAAAWRAIESTDGDGAAAFEPPPRSWPGAGSIQALGERWAAQQPGAAPHGDRDFVPDALGIGVSVDGGRADALAAEDPDAATLRATEASLRDALAQAQQAARPWEEDPSLRALFALPDAPLDETAPLGRRWDPLSATLPNAARMQVAVSPTGENGVLVVFDGGPGEDGEPLHGRSALAISALAQRCARMLGSLDGVHVATRVDADRVGMWFEDAGAGWTRVADVAARCALEHTPDDTDLLDAKRELLAVLGPEGSDARMRAWAAAALNPSEPGRVAPLGSGERLDAVRLGDVTRALERLRVGARTHMVAFVRAQPSRAARRMAPRLAALTRGEPFEPSRSRALGDSPHAVAWVGATPDHARLVVAFRDPVSLDPAAQGAHGAGAPSQAQLGQAHATALAGRLRALGLDVVWLGGAGGAYGHWSAVTVETTLEALDGLPARIEAALRAELPVAATLSELARPRALSLGERALASLGGATPATSNPTAGPRYVVARPQGAAVIRRRKP